MISRFNYNTGTQTASFTSIEAALLRQRMDHQPPAFSIIVLAWNSAQTLPACLEALRLQTVQDFELLLVDNGSAEPVPQALMDQYARLNLRHFRLEQNRGFAGGNNFAVQQARAATLVLLNADAFPRADWLEAIQQGVSRHPGSFFTCRQRMAGDERRLDGSGDIYHASGMAWRRDYGMLEPVPPRPEGEVFSACGATAVYPRAAFLQAGGFDEDYFSYVEDVDLGFRLRLLGLRCIYLPQAQVVHVGSASTSRRSDLVSYYGHRNLVWTYLKDMPGVWVWLLALPHLAVNLLALLVGASRGQGRVIFKAKWDALRGAGAVLRKRKAVQESRKTSTWAVMRQMDWNPLSPLLKSWHR